MAACQCLLTIHVIFNLSQQKYWSKVNIAKKIQESPLGRKNGTAMTYSIDFIIKSIRTR